MKYDDASWHYGGDFPEDSPQEYGGTHIALFMKWCFIKGWAGEEHMLDAKNDVEKVIASEMSATEFFFKYCDGKLTNEDFTAEGNEFAKSYYAENDLYLSDYGDLFFEEMYITSEQEHDFDKLSKLIEERYISFSKQDNGSIKTTASFSGSVLSDFAEENSQRTPWWKFWA